MFEMVAHNNPTNHQNIELGKKDYLSLTFPILSIFVHTFHLRARGNKGRLCPHLSWGGIPACRSPVAKTVGDGSQV